MSENFPELKPVSLDAGGAVLTRDMLDKFFACMNDPERIERGREARIRREDELNRYVKQVWANHLGKAVGELTKEDMKSLNETLFQGWLAYKGITEEEFLDWIG